MCEQRGAVTAHTFSGPLDFPWTGNRILTQPTLLLFSFFLLKIKDRGQGGTVINSIHIHQPLTLPLQLTHDIQRSSLVCVCGSWDMTSIQRPESWNPEKADTPGNDRVSILHTPRCAGSEGPHFSNKLADPPHCFRCKFYTWLEIAPKRVGFTQQIICFWIYFF